MLLRLLLWCQEYELEVLPGDVLVLGTDGLLDNLFPIEIALIVGEAQGEGCRPEVRTVVPAKHSAFVVLALALPTLIVNAESSWQWQRTAPHVHCRPKRRGVESTCASRRTERLQECTERYSTVAS